MYEASKAQNYELATKLRNQLQSLQALRKKIVFSDKEFLNISSDQALKQLQMLLKSQHPALIKPPVRIEGYDVSHQSGTNAVASMVVFTNGTADRAEYRKFKIRQKNSQDDLASLTETITRRLKHPEWPYPDLIILDGGITQINAVKDQLTEHHIAVIGRDKSGDHSHSAPVNIVLADGTYHPLPTSSHIARLIARIDEEAHRFAITYHTLLKRKNMLK